MTPRKKPNAEEAFQIGGEEINPGRLRRLELPVARLPTGSWLSLPLAVIHGAQGGPTVWLSAAIHGDELNGTEIIRLLLRDLDPRQVRGTIIAAPAVNVFGLLGESRYLPDGRDLNRSFPGSKRGSLASQLAHLFMTQVVSRCQLGIDFHTGSNQRTNLPQVRCNLDEPQTKSLARAFGAPLILHAKRRDGSLRGAAHDQGIRVLLYEGGEALRFDDYAIQTGYEGALRVLAHENIIPPNVPVSQPSAEAHKSLWVRARRTGFCRLRTQLGARVNQGDTLAEVSDAIGQKTTRITANVSGLVIGLSTRALLNRGDALAHIAVVD